MKLTRTTALAALLLVALAAPAAAFALDNRSDDEPGQQPSHAATAKDDKAKDDKTKDHRTKDDEAKDDEAKDDKAKDDKTKDHKTKHPGRAHAEAMKAWARCVAEAASGPKSDERTGPPKEACGDKPMAPGRAKHEAGGPAHPSPPGRSEDHQRGKSGTHKSR